MLKRDITVLCWNKVQSMKRQDILIINITELIKRRLKDFKNDVSRSLYLLINIYNFYIYISISITFIYSYAFTRHFYPETSMTNRKHMFTSKIKFQYYTHTLSQHMGIRVILISLSLNIWRFKILIYFLSQGNEETVVYLSRGPVHVLGNIQEASSAVPHPSRWTIRWAWRAIQRKIFIFWLCILQEI